MKAITQERIALAIHVRNQNLNYIKKFIEDHQHKNNYLIEKDENGRTILYDIVHTVNADILDYFLKLSNTRYKINDVDNMKMSVLDYLLSLKTYKDINPCKDLLIKAGATCDDKFRHAYSGNTYHLNGDLPKWSPINNSHDNNSHDNHNHNDNHNNQSNHKHQINHFPWSILYIIVSYIIVTLISIVTGFKNLWNDKNNFWPAKHYFSAIVNCTNWFNTTVLYINKYEDIKNDLLNVDIIMIFLTVLVLIHCFMKTKTNGFMVVIIILGVTILAEQLSIQLGETHCHFDAWIMITKCSSLNSVIFYVPWMYSCYYIGRRIESTFRSRILLIALLHPLYCTMYELTGANEERWWSWGTKVPALLDRFYEVPIMAVSFHFFYGLCFALCYNKFSIMKIHQLLKIILCIIVPPTTACILLTSFSLFNIIGLSNYLLTFMLLLGSMLVVIYDISHSKTKRINNVKNVKDMSDYILFSIPLVFYSFILWSNNILFEVLLFDISFIPYYKMAITINVIVGYIIILSIMYFY